jgi:hypothetical protein
MRAAIPPLTRYVFMEWFLVKHRYPRIHLVRMRKTKKMLFRIPGSPAKIRNQTPAEGMATSACTVSQNELPLHYTLKEKNELVLCCVCCSCNVIVRNEHLFTHVELNHS